MDKLTELSIHNLARGMEMLEKGLGMKPKFQSTLEYYNGKPRSEMTKDDLDTEFALSKTKADCPAGYTSEEWQQERLNQYKGGAY